ncbi:acyl-CoA N-acyltransferase [Pyrenochaeta sp. MPI-SDFR-AT-0127]|nr:acyl-CoA N-acyltransferase [Pyrenochaeta sp. MPI-SDFR-AT-0127]
MGYVVLPAVVKDISAVYDAYFAAFKNSPVTRAFFPSATQEDLTNPESEFRKGHTAHIFQYWQESSTQYTLKCVDSETGQIVGMALWDVYLTPSDWKKGEITWLQGKERERAEALVSPLWNAREKMWLNQKYLYCHVIAVHPSFQRRGIGELLFRYGIDIAQETGLPIYIESSKEAERLYEKMGSRRLKERPIHRPQDLWLEDDRDTREDREIALFVWIPEGGSGKLPNAAILA